VHLFRVRLHRAPPLPVRVGDVGARVVPLAVELEGEHARPPDHRFRIRARHRRAARLEHPRARRGAVPPPPLLVHLFRVRLHRAPPLPVRVGDVGARVVPLAVELEGEHARPPDHRFRVRAKHRRAARLDPSTAGPVTTSPVTTSPVTTSPVTAGPVAAGAVTAGPVAAGPSTAGPVATSVERKLHKVARLHIHPYRVTYRSRGFHTEIFNRHGTVCTCSMQNIDNDTQLVGRFLHKDSVPLPGWQCYGTGNLSAATTVFTNTLYSIDVH